MIVFDIFLNYYNNCDPVVKTDHLECIPYKYLNICFDSNSIHKQELTSKKFISNCTVFFANIYTFLQDEKNHRLKLEIKIHELPYNKDIEITVIDYYNQNKLFERRVFDNSLRKILFSGEGNLIIFIEEKVVYIFDIFANQLIKKIPIVESEVVECVCVNMQASHILLASTSKSIKFSSGFPCGFLRVLDYDNLKMHGKKTYYMPITGLASDLNNAYIASVLWDGSIDILKSKQLDTICYFQGDGYSKKGINCFVDIFAQYIISLRNQKIQVWRIEDFKEIFSIRYSLYNKFVFEDVEKNIILLQANNQNEFYNGNTF